MFSRRLLIIILILIIGLVNYYSNIIEGNENMTPNETVNNTNNTDNTTTPQEDSNELNYDPTNLETDYIDESKLNINKEDAAGTAWVKDKDGNMVALKQSETETAADKLAGDINYYEPGTYKYGSSAYVPSYEDSIYLSKTTGKSTVAEVIDELSIKGGICTHYKDMPEKLEEACGKLDTNLCAATNCCVLLGGSKCVAGNATGPTSKLHYGDITIRNRDYYYYKGKCYGNCVK